MDVKRKDGCAEAIVGQRKDSGGAALCTLRFLDLELSALHGAAVVPRAKSQLMSQLVMVMMMVSKQGDAPACVVGYIGSIP